MADRLGKSVEETKRCVSSLEFIDWRYYLRLLDRKEVTKDQYYLARIAFELARRLDVRNDKLKFKDFILQFNQEEKLEAIDPAEVERVRAEYLERSKLGWMAMSAIPTPSLDEIKKHIPLPKSNEPSH